MLNQNTQNSFQKFALGTLSLLCLIFISGCDEIDRLSWSADGKHFAVVASDGLRIGDETGKISPPCLPDVAICRWMPDSEHAIVVSSKKTKSWPEVRALLSPAERQEAADLAQRIWKNPSILNQKDVNWPPTDVNIPPAALLSLISKYGAPAAKSKFAGNHLNLNDVDVNIQSVRVVDLLSKQPTPGPDLLRTTRDVDDVRPSPNGSLVAVSLASSAAHKIMVIQLNDSRKAFPVDSAADFPDWSIDNKSLFYASYPKESKNVSAPDDNHPVVVTLNSCAVADATGTLLPKAAAPRKILEVLAAGSTRVRCLPDGNVLFQAKARTFPGILKKEPARSNLFKLTPDFNHIEMVTPSRPMPDDQLRWFEPNQDGTKVCVPGGHGEVFVVDLATGNTTLMEVLSQDLKLVPHWRNKDELCFAAQKKEQPKGKHDAEIVLQSVSDASQRTVLSKGWPAAAVKFLAGTDESKKPADSGKPGKAAPLKHAAPHAVHRR